MASPEDLANESAIFVALQFIDERLPGRRQVQSVDILEYIAVMLLLTVFALLVE